MQKSCVLGEFYRRERSIIRSAQRLLWPIARRFIICAGVLSSGCSLRPAQAPPALPAALRVDELVRTYGRSRNTTCAPHLEERLSQIAPSSLPHISVIILASDTPFALSPGNATITLSAGLLRRLTTEGEALFLLAHEVAHYELGHVDEMGTGSLPDVRTRLGFEYAADAYAQQLLTRGGYDPQSGVRALLAVYSYGGIPKDDPAYPSLNERLVRLVQTEWYRGERDSTRGEGSFYTVCRGL